MTTHAPVPASTSPGIDVHAPLLPIDDDACRSASHVLELVGRRWSSSILFALGRGAHRFTQIQASVIGLSDRMLSVRLKELERAELVARVVEPTTPVSVRYELTPRGRDLIEAMQPLVRYGHRWETRR
ncbi:MAG: helix-turn-helix transcriptional regulator [Cellulomonas sp.]|nr:helix-turn-helix domain-containing protein [Cellulomonas sp.]MCR6647248.1 helix-turn-helix transcriptional regulator [Cellulomonas sp.]